MERRAACPKLVSTRKRALTRTPIPLYFGHLEWSEAQPNAVERPRVSMERHRSGKGISTNVSHSSRSSPKARLVRLSSETPLFLISVKGGYGPPKAGSFQNRTQIRIFSQPVQACLNSPQPSRL